MTEAIVCAVIAAIAAVTVGLINAFSQKKTKQDLSAEFQKELQEAREKERARQKYEVYMIKGIMASNTLSEATARAVQRIPDAHCSSVKRLPALYSAFPTLTATATWKRLLKRKKKSKKKSSFFSPNRA